RERRAVCACECIEVDGTWRGCARESQAHVARSLYMRSRESRRRVHGDEWQIASVPVVLVRHAHTRTERKQNVQELGGNGAAMHESEGDRICPLWRTRH